MDALSSVTAIAGNAWSFVGDFALVLVIFGFLFTFAWYIGRGPFIGLLTSFYVAYALYAAFPYATLLPTAPPWTAFAADFALYVAFVILFYIILRRVVASDFIWVGIFGLAILSLLGTGLVLALLYHVFPTRAVYGFTPLLNAFFAPKEFFYWWFIAPVIGLFVLAR